MTDLRIFGQTFTDVKGIKATDTDGNEVVYGDIPDYFKMKMSNAECDEYRNDDLTIISTGFAIQGWSNLRKLTLPNVTRLAVGQAFGNNGNVNLEVNLKSLQTSNNQGIQGLQCKCLVLPNWQGNLNTYVIYGGNIPIVDIGSGLGAINGNSLTSCRDTLILRRTSDICPLQNTNALYAATWGASGTGGKLYVPQALISAYESASNWSTLLGYPNNQILPIEGSIYEHQYADGTPIK